MLQSPQVFQPQQPVFQPQQQVQLPYSISQLQSNPQQYQIGTIQFNWPNITNNPDVNSWLPVIVLSCVNAIQSGINNPLRVFLYNQLSENGYQNQRFFAFVKLTSDYIDMCLVKGGSGQDVNSLVNNCILQMVEMACAENTQLYPALYNQLDYNLKCSVNEVMKNTQIILNSLTQFKNQSNPQPQPFQPQQQGAFYGNPSQQPSMFTNQNSSMGGFNQPTSNRPSAFVERVPDTYKPPPGNIHVRNMSGAPSAPVVQPVIEPVITTYANSAPGFKWKPSEDQLFTWAFNFYNEVLIHKVLSDGVMCPDVIILSSEEKSKMLKDKHFKPSIADSSWVNPGSEQSSYRYQSIANGIKNNGVVSMEQEAQELKEFATQDELLEIENNPFGQLIGLSDQEIWKDCELRLFSKKKNDKKVIGYCAYAYVNDVLIGPNDSTVLADKLAKCEDFMSASNVLQNTLSRIKENVEEDVDMICVNFFNKRLTEAVNRFLKNGLAVDVTSTNFMEDGNTLLKHIENTYTEKFSDPLRACQRELILSCCTYASSSYYEKLASLYIPPEIDDIPYVAFYYTSDHFMSIDIFASELRFDIPKVNHSVAIMQDRTPLLYSVAKYIFTELDTRNSRVSRSLIRTLDRKVFTLTRSVIDKSTFLIAAA